MSYRILYLAPDVLISGSHGGSSHVSETVNSLAKLGNKVYLLCRSNGIEIKPSKDITIIGLPVINLSFIKSLLYLFYTFSITLFCLTFLRINLVYERGRIFGGLGVLLASLYGKKSVYELNEPYISLLLVNDILTKKSLRYKIVSSLHKSVVSKASLTTVTNNHMERDAPNGRYLLVWWGTDPEIFRPDIKCDDVIKEYNLHRGKTLLYVGSFSEWHSCETMIEIIRRLVKGDKEIKLIMIGDGEKRKNCKSLVKKYKLENKVVFVDKLNHSEVPKFINASDICFALFDRRYKPFKEFSFFYSPIKIHEYKACGKPIIASNFGNLKKLVNDKINGMLVDESDINSVVRAVKILMENKNLVKEISKNNRNDVLIKYNWDEVNKFVLKHL